MKLNLSIVVITKNEEKNIERCLDSLTKQLKNHSDWEIIVVDSASNDQTVKFACRYNCKIIELKANIYSAALGRQVGYLYAKNKTIMFLDGDMEICNQWIEESIYKLQKMSDEVVGIVGIRIDKVYKNNFFLHQNDNVYKIKEEGEVKNFGGALMIKKSILDVVGGFDIRMVGNEEAELHSRILKENKKIWQIPVPMITHHTKYLSKVQKIRGMFSLRGLSLGTGLRLSIEKRNFKHYFIRLKKFLIPMTIEITTILLLVLFLIYKINVFICLAIFIQIVYLMLVTIYANTTNFLLSKIMMFFCLVGVFLSELFEVLTVTL